jgi:GDPmannose 4,6-dehydratase
MTDTPSLSRLISTIRPDEVYNLAAQSHVGISFKTPEYTGQADAMGALRILEAIKSTGLQDTCRYYQASTSELYGQVKEVPQNETTPFHPRSPYAVAKLYAHWITINYRESFGLYALNGIMFNHESPRRGENFVTRKITLSLANILAGKQQKLVLGNLNSKRDWGHARDYVEGMWLALQQEEAEDYVFATGVQQSIRDFVVDAFGICGFDIEWRGEGMEEKGVDRKSGRVLVEVDQEFFRPAEVDMLIGDASKAREKLGWEPRVKYSELVRIMVKEDLLHKGLNPDEFMISLDA